jgi:hypothetical protein
MTRAVLLSLVVLGAALTAAPQQPTIQHAKIETRTSTALERDVAGLVASATDPVWIAWRVAIIDGEHNACCYSSFSQGDDNGNRGWSVGCGLEPQSPQPAGAPAIERTQFPAHTGPVTLEGGTGLIVLVRAVDHRIERLRTLSDDCPMDAGDRTMYWLDGVTGAASLQYLQALVVPTASATDERRAISDRALAAIALHRDTAAADILTTIAHTPDDTRLRAQALVQIGRRGGPQAAAELQRAIEQETSADVRRSALSGLLQLPNNEGVPVLIQLARTGKDATLRKDAMSRLQGSKDPRAIAFFEEILRRP